MTTKNTQFFSKVEEFLSILTSIIEQLNLYAVLYRGGINPAVSEPIAELTVSAVSEFAATRIYLTESAPDSGAIDPCNIRPAAWGAIQVDLPVETESVLFMAQIAVKSDWMDQQQKKIRENSTLLKTFDKINRLLKKKMASPVMAENIMTGSSQAYKNIYYTSSASNFFNAGGELAQRGVNNIRYTLPNTTKIQCTDAN